MTNLALLPDGALPWDSGDLYKGEAWSHTFTVRSDYIYFSRRRSSTNLLGTVSVCA